MRKGVLLLREVLIKDRIYQEWITEDLTLVYKSMPPSHKNLNMNFNTCYTFGVLQV